MAQRQSGPILTIGLLWHSLNSSNYGIGALTGAHIAVLDDLEERLGRPIRYEVIGWSDPMPRYVEHPNMTFHGFSRRFLLSRRGLYALARKCDIVLDIGGGDSWADIYGVKRFWYQTLSKAVVLASGTPLILAPQTIGPFDRGWARRIARTIMRRCRAVVARDAISADFTRALDPRIPLVEATDVAFRLPYERMPAPPGDRAKVGINVSGLLFGGGYFKKNDFGLTVDYPSLVRELLARFLTRDDCEVHLFSHVIVPRRFDSVDDDLRIAERLGEEFPGVHVAPAYDGPNQAKSQFAGMDFFCGSRMHACIGAFSAGVPTVPMAYSRKFIGVFGTIGYPLVADCRADDQETIIAKVVDGFERREELRAGVAAANREADRRLTVYLDELVRCLTAGEAREDAV